MILQKNLTKRPLVEVGLISVAVLLFLTFLVLPLLVVLLQAFEQGFATFWQTVSEADTLSALKLTLLAVAIAVPLNIVFGVAAAWAVTKYQFRGRHLLLTLIYLPFSISPIVAGLIYVLLFDAQSWPYPYLEGWDLHIVYAILGIVLATLFVSVLFVARELIPIMETQGSVEEEAAAVLGANGW